MLNRWFKGGFKKASIWGSEDDSSKVPFFLLSCHPDRQSNCSTISLHLTLPVVQFQVNRANHDSPVEARCLTNGLVVSSQITQPDSNASAKQLWPSSQARFPSTARRGTWTKTRQTGAMMVYSHYKHEQLPGTSCRPCVFFLVVLKILEEKAQLKLSSSSCLTLKTMSFPILPNCRFASLWDNIWSVTGFLGGDSKTWNNRKENLAN